MESCTEIVHFTNYFYSFCFFSCHGNFSPAVVFGNLYSGFLCKQGLGDTGQPTVALHKSKALSIRFSACDVYPIFFNTALSEIALWLRSKNPEIFSKSKELKGYTPSFAEILVTKSAPILSEHLNPLLYMSVWPFVGSLSSFLYLMPWKR